MNRNNDNNINSEKTGLLLDIPIGSGDLNQITDRALQAIEETHPPVVFACANPHSIVVAQNDDWFRTALKDADLVVADGVGVTVMGRIANADVGPRIAGEDFFLSLMGLLNSRGVGRIFFFGSSDTVLDAIRQRFVVDYPSLTLVGMLSPPYGEWSNAENDAMIQQINEATADVLWVAMTAPKQEKWVHRNFAGLNAKVIGSIGAVFDFYGGTIPRAPRWLCKLGLEWLYRLSQEPKRMWRRNFVSNPQFVIMVLAKHVLSRSLKKLQKKR